MKVDVLGSFLCFYDLLLVCLVKVEYISLFRFKVVNVMDFRLPNLGKVVNVLKFRLAPLGMSCKHNLLSFTEFKKSG